MSSLTDVKHRLIAVAIIALSTNAFGQGRLRESAREQALRDPSATLDIFVGPGHYNPKSIDDLARESVAVVTGRLVRKRSFLSSNEDYVLTDYDLSDPDVIRGRLTVPTASVPGKTALPVVTFWGGDVVVEGIRILATNGNFEAVQDGGHYLLFLMPTRGPGTGYEVYHGAIFEISSQQVKPLLKRGNKAFAWAAELPLAELLSRIRAAGAP